MRRRWILVALACLLAGCANQRPYAPDPFFGRTRVPPPSTGSGRANPTGAPFYPAPSAANSPAAASGGQAPLWSGTTTTSAATDPTGGAPAASAGGAAAPSESSSLPSGNALLPSGSGASRPRALGSGAGANLRIPPPDYARHPAAGLSTPASRPAAGQAWSQPAGQPTGGPSPGRASGPTPTLAAAAAASGAALAGSSLGGPRTLNVPDRVTDIMDLPDARTRQAKQLGGSRMASSPAAPTQR